MAVEAQQQGAMPASVRALAEELLPSTPALAEGMADHLHGTMPELADSDDEDLRAETRDSCAANIDQLLRLMRLGAAAGAFVVPVDAAEYVRSFVRRGFGVPGLLRSYRLGHAWLWDLWSHELQARIADPDELATAQDSSAAFMFAYVHGISDVLVEEYGTERERMMRSAAQLRAETVRAILAGEPVDEGRLDEAEALATRAAEVGTAAGQEDAVLIFAGQIVSLRYDQGRLEEVIALSEQSVKENPQLAVWRGFLARCLCRLGRSDEAGRLLCAEDFDALAHDFLRLATLAFWADACADLGAADRASDLYAELAPWSAQCLDNGISAWGSVSHYLGRLAATMERHGDAAEHFAAAEAAHRRLAAPILLARTHHAWASSLLASGDRREAARAEAMLERALAGARERGCAQLEREVERTLASAAVS